MRRALLIIPFIVPFVFGALYEPINRAWTVEKFGCGCPNIRGEFRAFNANHFNLILWFGVWVACGLSWWLLWRPEFKDRRSMPYVITQSIGLGVLLCICFNRFGRGFWL